MDPFGEIMESAYYLEQQSIDPFLGNNGTCILFGATIYGTFVQ